MTNVVQLKAASLRLACSACGAEAEAGCNCGVAYIPAGARAAEGVAATPHLSDRAIAKNVGVSAPTVSAARRAGVKDFTPERRVGRDGKSYPAPVTAPPAPRRDARSPDFRAFEEGPIAWHNRAESAANMATYAPFETCPRTRKMRRAIAHVIAEWTALKKRLDEEE